MKLSWSHAVLNVKDPHKMLAFYTEILGFKISDRGPIGDNGPELIFMSQDPDEHHQLAMAAMRQDDAPPNTLNHFAFRVESFDEVKALNDKLVAGGIDLLPLSHGNTLSLYFGDPEGNGIEVFWDTPWHIAQPQGAPWDTSLDEQQALDWVEETFRNDPTFMRREETKSTFANRD